MKADTIPISKVFLSSIDSVHKIIIENEMISHDIRKHIISMDGRMS